jgi:hypothetical protein
VGRLDVSRTVGGHARAGGRGAWIRARIVAPWAVPLAVEMCLLVSCSPEYSFNLHNSCGVTIQWRMSSDLHPGDTFGSAFLASVSDGSTVRVSKAYPSADYVLWVRRIDSNNVGKPIALSGAPVELSGELCPRPEE